MTYSTLAAATLSGDQIHRHSMSDVARLNAFASDPAVQGMAVAIDAMSLERITTRDFSPSEQSSIMLRPIREGSELAADWNELPPAIAVRCTPPEAEAVVVIPSSVLGRQSADGEFRDVSDPVWDWLIRQVNADVTVQIRAPLTNAAGAAPDLPRPRLVPAAPGLRADWLRDHLLHTEHIDSLQSPVDGVALRAGLLQIHDFLDESHRQSQSVEGEGRNHAGDYWHAIMHRREPDYGNSKYWFRRVGRHPVFDELANLTSGILDRCGDPQAGRWRERLVTSSGWDPFAFVDLCASLTQEEDSTLETAARELQWQEMRLLLRHTYRDALGDRVRTG